MAGFTEWKVRNVDCNYFPFPQEWPSSRPFARLDLYKNVPISMQTHCAKAIYTNTHNISTCPNDGWTGLGSLHKGVRACICACMHVCAFMHLEAGPVSCCFGSSNVYPFTIIFYGCDSWKCGTDVQLLERLTLNQGSRQPVFVSWAVGSFYCHVQLHLQTLHPPGLLHDSF